MYQAEVEDNFSCGFDFTDTWKLILVHSGQENSRVCGDMLKTRNDVEVPKSRQIKLNIRMPYTIKNLRFQLM